MSCLKQTNSTIEAERKPGKAKKSTGRKSDWLGVVFGGNQLQCAARRKSANRKLTWPAPARPQGRENDFQTRA